MNLQLNPLYKKLLLLTIVLGPIVWLVFTNDGQRRTDIVILYLFGKAELNLAIEKLDSRMTETQFRELFPDLKLACSQGANAFGNRLCAAEVGSFNAIPARAFTLFLSNERLRAAKVSYRRRYHDALKRNLVSRLGSPRRDNGGNAPLTWDVVDGLLLLAPQRPESDDEAALIWLSSQAARQRLFDSRR